MNQNPDVLIGVLYYPNDVLNPDVLIGVILCLSQIGIFSKLIFKGPKSIFWLQSSDKAGESAERVVLLHIRVLISLSTFCR